ncbi:hypothetical protein C8R46DRAFT_1191645 [Mycena filopes]|nr:hypothetical protein C8R46DRAFT_1191645 [Mycena filopes]
MSTVPTPPPQPGPFPNPAQRQSTQPPFAVGIAAGAEDVKYQAKYKDLKRKVKEIEADNDKLHFKVLQAKRSIQRMKLERAVLYERLQQVPPSPELQDRQALPPVHPSPHQPPHQHHSLPPNRVDRTPPDYLRTHSGSLRQEGGQRTGTMDSPMAPSALAHASRRGSLGGTRTSDSCNSCSTLPPMQQQQQDPHRGHPPHIQSSHDTRARSPSRNRAPQQTYHPHPQQYPDVQQQHPLHSPPLSERSSRRHDMHDLGPQQHQSALLSPSSDARGGRAPAPVHAHQRMGPGTYINRDELERDWERDQRERGRARESSTSYFHCHPNKNSVGPGLDHLGRPELPPGSFYAEMPPRPGDRPARTSYPSRDASPAESINNNKSKPPGIGPGLDHLGRPELPSGSFYAEMPPRPGDRPAARASYPSRDASPESSNNNNKVAARELLRRHAAAPGPARASYPSRDASPIESSSNINNINKKPPGIGPGLDHLGRPELPPGSFYADMPPRVPIAPKKTRAKAKAKAKDKNNNKNNVPTGPVDHLGRPELPPGSFYAEMPPRPGDRPPPPPPPPPPPARASYPSRDASASPGADSGSASGMDEGGPSRPDSRGGDREFYEPPGGASRSFRLRPVQAQTQPQTQPQAGEEGDFVHEDGARGRGVDARPSLVFDLSLQQNGAPTNSNERSEVPLAPKTKDAGFPMHIPGGNSNAFIHAIPYPSPYPTYLPALYHGDADSQVARAVDRSIDTGKRVKVMWALPLVPPPLPSRSDSSSDADAPPTPTQIAAWPAQYASSAPSAVSTNPPPPPLPPRPSSPYAASSPAKSITSSPRPRVPVLLRRALEIHHHIHKRARPAAPKRDCLERDVLPRARQQDRRVRT